MLNVLIPPAGAVGCGVYVPAPADYLMQIELDISEYAARDCATLVPQIAAAIAAQINAQANHDKPITARVLPDGTLRITGCRVFKLALSGDEMALPPNAVYLLSTGCPAYNLFDNVFGNETEAHQAGLCIRLNPCIPDVNADGIVDVVDIGTVVDFLGDDPAGYIGPGPGPDTNGDGVVDLQDLFCVSQNFGRMIGPPAPADRLLFGQKEEKPKTLGLASPPSSDRSPRG